MKSFKGLASPMSSVKNTLKTTTHKHAIIKEYVYVSMSKYFLQFN